MFCGRFVARLHIGHVSNKDITRYSGDGNEPLRVYLQDEINAIICMYIHIHTHIYIY